MRSKNYLRIRITDHCRFLDVVFLTNLKGKIGLILDKVSVTAWGSPFPSTSLQGSRSFIPLPHFIHSRRPTPLSPLLSYFFKVTHAGCLSLCLTGFYTRHRGFNVTLFAKRILFIIRGKVRDKENTHRWVLVY